MNGRWQTKTKIDVAQQIMKKSLDELASKEDVELALRVYGDQSPISQGQQDCNDTRLAVPFHKNNIASIKSVLSHLQARGTTPIARSLEKAAGDFPPCDNCRNIIILVTDGIEACDGDPCAVSRALQAKGIVLKPFVIGLGLDDKAMASLECVGNFFDVTKEETFNKVLNIVISQALNNTTAQVNLLNVNSKPTETDVPVVMRNSASGKIQYEFMHTMNNRGNPDTLTFDPLLTYKLEAYTIPPVEKDDVQLTPGIHNIVAVDAPQGDLELKINGLNGSRFQAIVRKGGEMKTLNVQAFNSTERYLVGSYDLEVLTLPRMYINDVHIDQSHTTTVEVPEPGAVNIVLSSPGVGSILEKNGSKLKWVVNLNHSQLNQQFLLEPGKYQLVYRSRNSKQTIFTIIKEFDVTSGQSTQVNL